VSGDVLYRRTQVAWPTMVPLVAVAAILIPVFIRAQFVDGPWIVAGVYGVILLLFATMTVTVTSDGLRAAFGIGLVRKAVPFVDVVSFARVRNRWIDGWGIHPYPGGTLYNASGLWAVEFLMSNGRRVGIGTGEADALVAALQQATGKTEATHDARAGRVWGLPQTAAVVAAAVALGFAASTFYFGLQPPTAIVGYDAFYVSNGFYRNTIPYAAMTSVTLETALPRIGVRTNGFGLGGTLRGTFRLDDWGSGRLFINRGSPPFVVIRTGDSFVVVNFKDSGRTRALYGELAPHVDRKKR